MVHRRKHPHAAKRQGAAHQPSWVNSCTTGSWNQCSQSCWNVCLFKGPFSKFQRSISLMHVNAISTKRCVLLTRVLLSPLPGDKGGYLLSATGHQLTLFFTPNYLNWLFEPCSTTHLAPAGRTRRHKEANEFHRQCVILDQTLGIWLNLPVLSSYPFPK